MTREFVHVNLTGRTASYRVPFTISGAQLALTSPPYSSLLGMISYAADREVTPDDTRIGYRYQYEGKDMDLETIHRWGRRSTGSYTYKDTNIRNREIHYNITLDLFLDNLDLFDYFNEPKRPISFGRSQDLATIETVEIIEADPVEKGLLYGTLIPVKPGTIPPAPGIFYNLPEYFKYLEGKVRRPQQVRSFLALSQYEEEVMIDNLWAIQSDSEDVFYLHQWLE